MSQIGTLTTGAGVVTPIDIQFVPEFIVIGTAYGATPLSAIAWNIAGKEYVNVSGAAYVGALGKYKQGADLSGGLVAVIFNTGFGYLRNQQFQLRLTNAGVTTPVIYGYSRKQGNGQVITASQTVIIDAANQRFNNFMSLSFADTNVSRVNLTFRNVKTGSVFTDDFAPAELRALFALDNFTEAGQLDAITVIDNINLVRGQGVYVESAIVYASGNNVTVTIEGLGQI